jgi:ketosteroid isomerase-like protein/catechol 2,3-dioxygenase-like lactoylglutathione lyase family enzyme
MIHHMSFGVSDPKRVAHLLAELTGATPVRAPSPPFPYGAWFLLAGDDRGSFLEILPATTVLDPDAPLGLRQRPATFEPVNAHVLIGAAVSGGEIAAVAEREGWRVQEVETGLFKVVKLWIDGTVLVELLASGEAARYIETFGEVGMAALDGKLRGLEANMADALSAQMTPGAVQRRTRRSCLAGVAALHDENRAIGNNAMPASRRTLLAAAGAAGLASLATSVSAQTHEDSVMDQTIAELARRSAEANDALLRGDVDAYRALITLTDDFTLMSPFGGTPTRGADMTGERWEAMGRFFRNGGLEQEVVQTYGSADMVVLAIVERCRGEVGGLPAQDWPLRVTLVYCRDGSEWRLAHRHADPLVNGITLEQAAALARGRRDG